MTEYSAAEARSFLIDALDEYLDSGRFNSPAYYDPTVDAGTLAVLKDTVRNGLDENTSYYSTVEEYLDAYDENGQSSENLFQEAPWGMIACLIADTEELPVEPFRYTNGFINFDTAMCESLEVYIYGGACEFLKEAWEAKFDKVDDSYLV